MWPAAWSRGKGKDKRMQGKNSFLLCIPFLLSPIDFAFTENIVSESRPWPQQILGHSKNKTPPLLISVLGCVDIRGCNGC